MFNRRQFLHTTVACLAMLKTGLLFPIRVLAEWPAEAFAKDKPEEALAVLFKGREIRETDRITIEMPPGAENGAIVPLTVRTDLPEVSVITLIAEKNPVSLLGQFRFTGKGKGDYLRTRIKLAKSSHLIVVVESGGELCTARRYIEVLKGGCD